MRRKPALSEGYIQEYRQAIGKNIRALREAKGYSQDDLAGIMQVHRSTISKIETGKFAITIDYLIKFAWHLDFDVALVNVTSGEN